MLSDVPQLIVAGLTVGGIYAMIAIGFVTIYSVTGILNFAQGEFSMLGALLAVSLHKTGLALPLAILGAVVVVTVFGVVVERLAIFPARRASPVTLIIITIGVSIAIRGAALLIWGTDPYKLPAFSQSENLRLLGTVIVPQSLWILGVVLVCVAALWVLFRLTIFGLAFRACVINRNAARLMGIDPQLMSMFSFAISAFIGALAGVVITPLVFAQYDMGLMLGLKGFVSAVMGGLVSSPHAVAGAFLLGILESLGAGFISTGYRDALAFLILIIFLLFRPHGLLRSAVAKRV